MIKEAGDSFESCGKGLTANSSIILKIIEPIEHNGDRSGAESFWISGRNEIRQTLCPDQECNQSNSA